MLELKLAARRHRHGRGIGRGGDVGFGAEQLAEPFRGAGGAEQIAIYFAERPERTRE